MSNSSLVSFTLLSPNCNSPRKHPIEKITIHHMAGNLSIEKCGAIFADPARQASSNYGIGTDGRIGLYVSEENRSWCSSNADNDNRAITIEVANDNTSTWSISDKAMSSLIELCTDICKRNGIQKLNFTGNKNGNLTMHRYFAATACPGDYLASKFPYIAEEVNKRLSFTESSEMFYVQAGAFSSKENAVAHANRLKNAGYNALIKMNNGLYKVQVGAFKSKDNANSFAEKIKSIGFSTFITTDGGKLVWPS